MRMDTGHLWIRQQFDELREYFKKKFQCPKTQLDMS